MPRGLIRSVGLWQGVALYVGAVVGSGILILPGVAAARAGPAAILAWIFDGALGVPLALTFAALASRYPDAGGAASFTARAFGHRWGAIVGWWYFIAAANGQIVVPLTGAYYLAAAAGLDRLQTTLVAGVILCVALAANRLGLRVSGALQLALSAMVAALLVVAITGAIPHASLNSWRPFFPHGATPVAEVAVLLFFAFFGWEAIAHLSAEFKQPRDIVRSTLASVGVVSVLYLGVAAATIGAGAYGRADLDRVAVGELLGGALGASALWAAAGMALLITLGTTNAYVAAASRLGYALARDHAFPAPLAAIDARGVPTRALMVVGVYAAIGLAVTYVATLGAEDIVWISSSLGLATYVLAMAAGARLLRGPARTAAWVGLCATASVLLFASSALVLVGLVAGVAWLYVSTQARRSSK